MNENEFNLDNNNDNTTDDTKKIISRLSNKTEKYSLDEIMKLIELMDKGEIEWELNINPDGSVIVKKCKEESDNSGDRTTDGKDNLFDTTCEEIPEYEEEVDKIHEEEAVENNYLPQVGYKSEEMDQTYNWESNNSDNRTNENNEEISYRSNFPLNLLKENLDKIRNITRGDVFYILLAAPFISLTALTTLAGYIYTYESISRRTNDLRKISDITELPTMISDIAHIIVERTATDIINIINK